jgi:hypothetical protein
VAGLFISYRREDAAADAGRLFDDLVRRCRRDRVFMDLEIPPGADFREVLAEKLDTCDVVLALVGPRWLGAANPGSGGRRLDDPSDFVRMEIATALEKKKSVIPVILPGASIPRCEELPEAIRGLAWKNAFDLRRNRWAVDVNELVKHLPSGLQCGPAPVPPPVRVWAEVVLVPSVLLAVAHVTMYFTLPLDPRLIAAAVSLAFGGLHSLRFRLLHWQKLCVGLGIGLLSVLLDSILVPLLDGGHILPRKDELAATLRWFALMVAAIVAGYLAGSVAADAVWSRRGSGRGAA